jgi:hypothetical protein
MGQRRRATALDAGRVDATLAAMGVGSIVLGVVSLLMMFGGILLTWLPGVGSVLSFGAPVVALVGAVLGGLSMSRAKQEGESGGAGMAGLIVSIIAFLFGLIFALTCGLCNALCTAGMVAGPHGRGDGGIYWSTSTRGNPPPWLVDRDAGLDDEPDPDLDAIDPPDAGGAPPPAFPPPPIEPTITAPVGPAATPSPDPQGTPAVQSRVRRGRGTLTPQLGASPSPPS